MDAVVYSYEEAYQSSLAYFEGDESAARVWVDKYALKDGLGNVYEKTPDDMHRRMAEEVARVESKYPNPMGADALFDLFRHFKYIVLQGSAMSGLGNKYWAASLSNCFVIGADDSEESYGSIMKVDEEQVQLMRRGGGVGHDLSQIRPKGSHERESIGVPAGVVPFVERYSNSAREVERDVRRGSLMLSVSVRHPEVGAFVEAKSVDGKAQGANLSVRVDDAFMRAAIEGGQFEQRFPIGAENSSVRRSVSAKELWTKIVRNAWRSAEPSILFWDTIVRESVADCYVSYGFRTVSTNPCGDIPLASYDGCRMLALNLYAYVKNPFQRDAQFDYDLFKEHVRKAQRIVDDIVDLELEKIDAILSEVENGTADESVKRTELELWRKIKRKTTLGRRTGVGTTAEGDMLAAMGLTYGTPEAIYFSEQVHKTLAVEAYRSSVTLAQERGAFEMYNAELEANNPFINRLKDTDASLYADMVKYGRRNIACLTIAPMGTTSLMTQSSSGMEPVFVPVYKRRHKVDPNDRGAHVDYVDELGDPYEEVTVFHPKFLVWMRVNGYDTDKRYTQAEIDRMVAESPYHKATSQEVDWLDKVRMQSRIQRWVDHTVSVTINVPETANEALVATLYEEAWRLGCKGVTVYREGSRSGMSVAKKRESEKPGEAQNAFLKAGEARPRELEADVVRFQNNKEKWIAFVGLIEGRPYEIFTGLADDEDGLLIPKTVNSGKIIRNIDEDTGLSRYDFQYSNRRGYKTTIEGLSYKFNPEYWNYAKLISGVLRYGMPIDQVIKLVGGLQLNSETINNWKNGVERALKKYIPNGAEAKEVVCEKCGQKTVRYQEGCLVCTNCGYSKCGG